MALRKVYTHAVTSTNCSCTKTLILLPGGEDFIPRNGSSPQIVFSPDMQRRSVNVSILQDSVNEEGETFSLSLELATGPAKINMADHISVTILDSECMLFFLIDHKELCAQCILIYTT